MKEQRDNSAPVPLLIDGIEWRLRDETGAANRDSGLRLEPGTITVLMGPNGAGKTTLLEKLAGLRPLEGLQVSYGSETLWRQGWTRKKRLNERALRRYAYASQSPEDGLFSRSMREELDYSLRPYALSDREKEERRNSAMVAVGWDSSWLSRDPYQMSGGERRRAAIASVFVTPAPWLFLDEPTAGLDGAGHETLARQLENSKKDGKGILLISHDSDWALPMADIVLLLSVDGSLRKCSREELLIHPEWLEETGMNVPEWLWIAHLMVSNGLSADQAYSPAEAATAWPGKLREAAEAQEMRAVERQRRKERPKSAIRHRLTEFDPRSVWLSYVLISTGLLTLADWVALGVGAIIVFLLLTAGKVSLRRWRGLIVNYAVFSVLTSAIFAWGASGGGSQFEGEAFMGTLFTFVRTMLVLLLGLAIPLVMSPLSLRRSLEQMLTFKGKTAKWVQQLILTVTLMMRFIPVLLDLWERFVRIFLARGKSISRNPVAIGRRLRDVSLPFLLALFRLGDEVTLALESRGVGFSGRPTSGTRLRWRKRDYVFACGASALAIGLWFFANR
ncbi:ATP-binding cassette domain-containing protein [Cohnella luojiensis]|uniref:ATP-binding cassette domain-containing protein n=1 Tax=Cohnella luojiensis TaxID=652876 RepID=A0A4Y8LUA2_9BACL|nr:ATP-binding cassette domain-containing protein [Cohnella luojiensis]TFE19797.1 ATP-binding cassette domain-containing protein [Cohnella luojiensis]